MRTRFSVSARCAFSCASCECRCAYWRVLFADEEEEDDEEVELVEGWGFGSAREEGLLLLFVPVGGLLWVVVVEGGMLVGKGRAKS
jgi:hypothetical protein